MRSQFKTACLNTVSRPTLDRALTLQFGEQILAEQNSKLAEYAAKVLRG